MMLHAQDKGSVALETLLIMLPYARLEEHRLCFDGKNRQFFPFFAKNKDNLLLSPQKIDLTACYLAKISDYLLLSIKKCDLTADNRKKMRFFAISI
jgi:hypothetical protein